MLIHVYMRVKNNTFIYINTDIILHKCGPKKVLPISKNKWFSINFSGTLRYQVKISNYLLTCLSSIGLISNTYSLFVCFFVWPIHILVLNQTKLLGCYDKRILCIVIYFLLFPFKKKTFNQRKKVGFFSILIWISISYDFHNGFFDLGIGCRYASSSSSYSFTFFFSSFFTYLFCIN